MEATNNKRKIILIGLSVLGTGVAGFLGWNYWRNRKRANDESDDASFTELPTATAPPAPAPRNDEFPLKMGSKGSRVTQLQNALIKKFGVSILPKYGADGMFGKEVAAALVKAKLPASVAEADYDKLVGVNGLIGIENGEEIVTITDCEIFKCKSGIKLQAPKDIMLGEKEFVYQDWVYFCPKNSSTLFRVKQENVKSFEEFKNEKSQKN